MLHAEMEGVCQDVSAVGVFDEERGVRHGLHPLQRLPDSGRETAPENP
jgi:hypothetical protein